MNESTTVDNQNAIHTMLAGEMDNCKLKIDSYVIRAGNYIYDLVYWVPSDSFDYVKGDFENMVRSFKFTVILIGLTRLTHATILLSNRDDFSYEHNLAVMLTSFKRLNMNVAI